MSGGGPDVLYESRLYSFTRGGAEGVAILAIGLAVERSVDNDCVQYAVCKNELLDSGQGR